MQHPTVASLVALALAGLGAPVHAIEVQLELIAQGLTGATELVEVPDGTGRLFITDQTGRIHVHAGGTLLPAPFLDLSAKLPPLTFYDERGLLGIAFHPDYASNGRFFVRYSTPGGTSHTEILAEYRVSEGDPDLADPASERVLFSVDEPEVNHNGGKVAFGPDGYLYFSLGDGGGEGDGLADPDLPHGPIGNAQSLETPLGKVLRIDVDGAPEPGLAYAIPGDNPFVGVPGDDEIYAYGFRNPYRFSFDDGPGGDGALLVADVGQNLYEELDVVVRGGNYGWVIREGLHCFDPFDPDVPPPTCPDTGLGGEPLVDPVLEYDHALGISIIGGHVYRGRGLPGLVGRYVFGDFSATFFPGAGNLFHAEVAGPNAWVRMPLDLATGPLNDYLRGIGEDLDGELYVFTSNSVGPTGTSGSVYRLVTDSDGDGLADLRDNCTLAANPDQRDTNADGYGNACDADLDDDGIINFADLGLMKAVFFTSDPNADLGGDGSVNFTDLAQLKATFFGPPGPSGLAP